MQLIEERTKSHFYISTINPLSPNKRTQKDGYSILMLVRETQKVMFMISCYKKRIWKYVIIPSQTSKLGDRGTYSSGNASKSEKSKQWSVQYAVWIYNSKDRLLVHVLKYGTYLQYWKSFQQTYKRLQLGLVSTAPKLIIHCWRNKLITYNHLYRFTALIWFFNHVKVYI